jgi:hypothetical protein
MTLRAPRLVPILAALAVVAALTGLAAAQVEEIIVPQPSTSRSSETLVLSENFEAADSAIIPPFEAPSEDFSAEIDSGVYDIDALADDFTGAFAIPFGDNFTDVTVAIDAVLSGGTDEEPGRYIFVSCRRGEEEGGYRMEFRPQSSSVIIRALSGEAGAQLGNGAFNDGQPTPDQVRLELSCTGSTITGRVNGLEVVSVEDETFTEGGLDFGGGVYTISSGRVSVDFDNLAVSVPNALAPTQTSQPSPTAEPTLPPTSTPTPEPTATPTVEPTPTADRSAILAPIEQLRQEAMSREPVFGPSDGTITQVVGDSLDAQYTGVAVANFVARVSFVNPSGTDSGKWDFGLGFRQTVTGQHWRVIVRSDGTWSLAIAADFPRATGVIENLNREAGGENTVELIADGPVGYLLVNDAYAAMLDLSALQESGDIWAGSGFFLDFATAGAATEYHDFTIWSIGSLSEQPQIGSGQPAQEEAPAAATGTSTPGDEAATPQAATPEETTLPEITPEPTTAAADAAASPVAAPDVDGEAILETIRGQVADQPPVFGPASGEVVQGVGSIDIESAAVAVADFYTTVRFTNPASPDEPDHSWDVVVGFWHEGGDDQIRLVVASDGSWSAAQGTARPTVSGEAAPIQLGPARGNVIELAVVDGTGHLAINGEYVSSFVVPGSPQEGDIWIASGTFPENVQPGVPTLFSDWSVWSLENPAG